MASNPDSPLQPPSLAVENVSVTYPNGHRAIENVTFTLAGSTVCALVGVNGSGKSTLFNTIMGIVRPQTGTVQVNGLPVAQAMRQNGIAYVPQSENIDWHGALSGGQKKRVFLARALAQESRIIRLDEPFTGVDAKTEYAVMELLKTLRSEGYLMLVSTHNLGAVPQYCNEVVLINRSIIAHGGIDDIYTVDNLELTFGSVLKNIGLGDVAPQVRIISDDEHPAVFVDNRNNSP